MIPARSKIEVVNGELKLTLRPKGVEHYRDWHHSNGEKGFVTEIVAIDSRLKQLL
jgi:hypothetical protein